MIYINPIKFEVECDIKEICDRYNYTDPFRESGIWWAFPPRSVMAIPINVRYRNRLIWNESYPTSTPFELAMEYLLGDPGFVPWKYKAVWASRSRMTATCVRTDVYPLFWLYWWVYFRVKETLKLTLKWFIYVLEVWGLAEIGQYEIASWQNIKIFKSFLKKNT